MIRRTFLKMLMASPLLGLLKAEKRSGPEFVGEELYLDVGNQALVPAGVDRCVCGMAFPDYGVSTEDESYMFYCRCGRHYYFFCKTT